MSLHTVTRWLVAERVNLPDPYRKAKA